MNSPQIRDSRTCHVYFSEAKRLGVLGIRKTEHFIPGEVSEDFGDVSKDETEDELNMKMKLSKDISSACHLWNFS